MTFGTIPVAIVKNSLLFILIGLIGLTMIMMRVIATSIDVDVGNNNRLIFSSVDRKMG